MRDLLQTLIEDSRPVAFCRLVATRGSTPQKAGAAMLVYANGEQAGTLGGGCVEAEVKRQAIALINDGGPAVVSFQLDHDYGWDDGLICGGRMDVMMWPLVGEQAGVERDGFFQSLHQSHVEANGGVEVIHFETQDDSSLPIENAQPICLTFDADRKLTATLSRTPVDSTLIQQAAAGIDELGNHERPRVLGGFLYLPIEKRYRLVIVGAGHVGKAVAELASQLGFDICIVDDRAEFVTESRFPMAAESGRVFGRLSDVLPSLEIDSQTFCLIVTRGHNHDQEALFHLVNRGAKYVGMIGSRRKVSLIMENLLAEGIPQSALDAVHAPVGIEIGSQTVTEIAVSIAAQLIAVRRGAV